MAMFFNSRFQRFLASFLSDSSNCHSLQRLPKTITMNQILQRFLDYSLHLLPIYIKNFNDFLILIYLTSNQPFNTVLTYSLCQFFNNSKFDYTRTEPGRNRSTLQGVCVIELQLLAGLRVYGNYAVCSLRKPDCGSCYLDAIMAQVFDILEKAPRIIRHLQTCLIFIIYHLAKRQHGPQLSERNLSINIFGRKSGSILLYGVKRSQSMRIAK